MRIAVLGTGIVGRSLAGKLADLGHDVLIGTRDVDALMRRTEGGIAGEPYSAWAPKHPTVRTTTFDEAAAHGELIFNATEGAASLEALRSAGGSNLAGKVLIDVANALDFSAGMPPTLTVANTDSLGEQIQAGFPETKVVKTLNTVNAMVMVNPGVVGGGVHQVFVCGNDDAAKAEVTGILRDWFGWQEVMDIGDIKAARGAEMFLPLWVSMFMKLGPFFNIRIVTQEA